MSHTNPLGESLRKKQPGAGRRRCQQVLESLLLPRVPRRLQPPSWSLKPEEVRRKGRQGTWPQEALLHQNMPELSISSTVPDFPTAARAASTRHSVLGTQLANLWPLQTPASQERRREGRSPRPSVDLSTPPWGLQVPDSYNQ